MNTGPAFHTRSRMATMDDSRPTGVPDEVLRGFESIGQFDEYAQTIVDDLARARRLVGQNQSRHSTPQRPRGHVRAANLPFPTAGLDPIPNESQSYWEGDTYLQRLHSDAPEDPRPPPFIVPPVFRKQSCPHNNSYSAPATNAGARVRDTNPLNFNVPDISNPPPGSNTQHNDNQGVGRGQGSSSRGMMGRGGNRSFTWDRVSGRGTGTARGCDPRAGFDCDHNDQNNVSNECNLSDQGIEGLRERMYDMFHTPKEFRKRTEHAGFRNSNRPMVASAMGPPPNQGYSQGAVNFNQGQGPTQGSHSHNSGYFQRGQNLGNIQGPPHNAGYFQQGQNQGNGQGPQPNNMGNFNQGYPPQGNYYQGGSNNTSNFGISPVINWHVKGPEPKIPKFSGNKQDYPEWKSCFRMLMDEYPDSIRVQTVKDHLDPSSQSLVAFISVTDVDAYELIWEELDRKNLLGLSPAHFHNGQLLKLIRRNKCTSISDLEYVYNQLKYHWSKLCKLGPQYAGYAESVLVGISDILYGQSQIEVDRLAYENRNFNVPSVLRAIWNHIGQSSARLSNHRLAEEFISKPTNNHFSQHGSAMPSHTNFQPRPVSPHSSGQNHRGHTVTFLDQKAKRDDSPYPRLGNSSPLPGARLDQSPGGTNRGRSPGRSPSPSGRSGSPSFRGQTAPPSSPRVNRGRSFKCSFCSTDEHKSLQCSRFSSEEYLQMVNNLRLCFICLLPGHEARVCPYPNYCGNTACSKLPKHSGLLCKGLSQ